MSGTGSARSPFFKIEASMVSLKTGDVLSILVPGATALYAIAPHVLFLGQLIRELNNASIVTGVALMIAAAYCGGILEAITRIFWEKHILIRAVKPPSNVLCSLRDDPHNLALYERYVQSSYKYVTFYANMAWATVVLIFGRFHEVVYPYHSAVGAVLIVGLLLRASYVQWTYYAKTLEQVFNKPPLDIYSIDD